MGTIRRAPRITKMKPWPANPPASNWALRLYVAGQTPKSIAAFNNLQRICEEELGGKYHIEVIDLTKHPQLARDNQILAVPTVVRKLPLPVRSIIGDLSNMERVLVGLEIVGDTARRSKKKRDAEPVARTS